MSIQETIDGALQPHDLLFIGGPEDLRSDAALPAWALHERLSVAPVVMRREVISERGVVPVGLRGRARSERFAAYVPRERIHRRVTPEALAETRASRGRTEWAAGAS